MNIFGYLYFVTNLFYNNAKKLKKLIFLHDMNKNTGFYLLLFRLRYISSKITYR